MRAFCQPPQLGVVESADRLRDVPYEVCLSREGGVASATSVRQTLRALGPDTIWQPLRNAQRYSAGRREDEPADIWQHLTADWIERDVMTVVLPDDAEETGDAHPWDWLVELLDQLGVVESADRLREVPYEVRLGPRALSRLER